jgi:hypothetical protein
MSQLIIKNAAPNILFIICQLHKQIIKQMNGKFPECYDQLPLQFLHALTRIQDGHDHYTDWEPHIAFLHGFLQYCNVAPIQFTLNCLERFPFIRSEPFGQRFVAAVVLRAGVIRFDSLYFINSYQGLLNLLDDPAIRVQDQLMLALGHGIENVPVLNAMEMVDSLWETIQRLSIEDPHVLNMIVNLIFHMVHISGFSFAGEAMSFVFRSFLFLREEGIEHSSDQILELIRIVHISMLPSIIVLLDVLEECILNDNSIWAVFDLATFLEAFIHRFLRILDCYAERILAILIRIVESPSVGLAVVMPLSVFGCIFQEYWPSIQPKLLPILIQEMSSENLDVISVASACFGQLANLLGDLAVPVCRRLIELLRSESEIELSVHAMLFSYFSDIVRVIQTPYDLVQMIYEPFLRFTELLFQDRAVSNRFLAVYHFIRMIINMEFPVEPYLNIIQKLIEMGFRIHTKDGELVEPILSLMKTFHDCDVRCFCLWVIMKKSY